MDPQVTWNAMLQAAANREWLLAQEHANALLNWLHKRGYPKRAGTTWYEFLRLHAASLWQCDFFSQKVLTLRGIREVFVLVFLHVQTRRVIMSSAMLHPNELWVTEQAKAFVNQARKQGLKVAYAQRDRGGKYAGFDATVQLMADRVTTYNWDRGLDQPAADALTQAIVDFLAGGFADHIYVT